MKICSIIVLLFVFSCNGIFAQTMSIDKTSEPKPVKADTMEYSVVPGVKYLYTKPGYFKFITQLPKDFGIYCKTTFRKENTLKIASMIAGTGLLVLLDQPILDETQRFGNSVGIKGTTHQKTILDPVVKIGKTKINLPLNFPWDLNTGMYFLGDGWTHSTITLSFWLYGKIHRDYRALQTASQLGESIILSGITTQFLKHITGRQSPFTVEDTEKNPGGMWRLFPNQKVYAKHVPEYDAYPSGHLATAMATVTVIAENYPEYKYIRPLGYTLMSLLAFSMVNNGVHWVSDYPLSIALGYTYAKIAVSRGRFERKTEFHHSSAKRILKSINVFPSYYGNTMVVSASASF